MPNAMCFKKIYFLASLLTFLILNVLKEFFLPRADSVFNISNLLPNKLLHPLQECPDYLNIVIDFANLFPFSDSVKVLKT